MGSRTDQLEQDQKNKPTPSGSGRPALRAVPDAALPGLEAQPKRKRRIDPDFKVTDRMREWAAGAVPGMDVDAETERFVDYWLGRGEPMLDWAATWRNWMRRSYADPKAVKARQDAERASWPEAWR